MKTPGTLWIASLLLPSLASASTPAVSLNEAYFSAVQLTEPVQIQTSQQEQAEERVKQAKRSFLPRVSLLGSFQRQDAREADPNATLSSFTDPNQYNARINAIQPIFRGLQELAGLRTTRSQAMAETIRVEQSKVQVFSNVARVYFDALAAEQDLKNLRHLETLTKKRIDELRARVQIGRTRKGDLVSSEVQLATLQSQLQQAEARVTLTRERLSLTTGIALGPREEPRLIDPEAPTTVLPISAFLADLEKRPDVRVFSELRDVAEAEVINARSGHFPTIDATGNYWLKRTGPQEGVNWDVGVLLVIPIFQGGVVLSQVRQASLRVHETELNLSQTRRTAETEIRDLHAGASAGLSQLISLQNALEKAEQNFEIQTRDFRLGLVTNLEVLQSMNSLEETKRVLDQTRYQTLAQLSLLNAAVGKLPLP